MAQTEMKTFLDVAKFVDRRADAVVLAAKEGGGKVLVSPRLQGRVMTSSFDGDEGASLGWVNAGALQELDSDPKFSNYGGEDRFWLGPEGGQFSIFFDMGAPQTLECWRVPECIGAGSMELRGRGLRRLVLGRATSVKNASNTRFTLDIERTIELIELEDAPKLTGAPIPASVKMVAFSSTNTVTNTGEEPWTPETGLLSIWALGMFNPSERTVVVAPFKPDANGPILKDDYFREIPGERLKTKSGYAAFLADGLYRSKIGIPPARAAPRIGSYDFGADVLTVVEFSLPGSGRYVNSAWGHQEEPYRGDVSNSYNDGPAEPGGPSLGGFYELESSSPALELGPGDSAGHTHSTYHFNGPRDQWAQIAQATLGADINKVEKLFFK